MTKRHYFGTDGIRGEVGGDIINPEFMLYLGWAAGEIFTQGRAQPAKVFIGKDTRQSCDMLEAALTSGLMAAGVDVAQLGILPTPAVAHFTHSLQATAGIVISASHNPFQDNGVKFFSNEGRKLDDTIELEIEQRLAMPISLMPKHRLGRLMTITDAHSRYVEFCKNILPSGTSLPGLKLVIDCAHGATTTVAKQIFSELDADVILIGDQPNGYNINENCGSTQLELLRTTVLREKADVGIAFDGDGDRVLMVDHEGIVVDGDELLCILACYQDGHEVVGVVGTAMSNLGLEKALTQAGMALERTAVGDRYVLERLLQKGWFLGGESSGHIINLHHTTTGDGIISALQVLAIIARTQLSLHRLKQVMVKRPQVMINVPIKEKIDLQQPTLEQAIADAEAQLQDCGRVLLRASGTEPLIRVMVEGNDADEVNKIAQNLAQHVSTLVQSPAN